MGSSFGVTNVVSRGRDTLRTELWPVPTLGVVLAVAAGVLMPRLDAHIDDALPEGASVYLFGGGAGAARTVLDAVASSLITVTSLTFSLTVVTLQLASSQFSPRLLRTFTRDRVVHVTLARFLATFTYALTVLRVVRTGDEGQAAFVPQISVTLAFALALASVMALVLFLAHLARQIRVETMLVSVHTDASQTLLDHTPDHTYAHASAPASGRMSGPGPEDDDHLIPAGPPGSALPIMSAASGFLIRIEEQAVLKAATDADAVVMLDARPGDFVVAGTPIGSCWPRSGSASAVGPGSKFTDLISEAVLTGFERTAAQDVGFGLRQLTDVAVKALSPGINDPTTAVHALGHSSALLCEMAARTLGPRVLTDPQNQARVVLSRPTLADLLDVAVAQPRRYGAADPSVLARLADLLRELAWNLTSDDQQPAIRDQLERLRATIESQDFDSTELAELHRRTNTVEQALQGRRPPQQATADPHRDRG